MLPVRILLDPSMSAIPIPLWQYAEEDPDGVERAETILESRPQDQPVSHKRPREIQPLFSSTLSHYDGFSGMGIPHICLLKALQQLWSEGIQIQLTSVYSYEIDADAILASIAIRPNLRLAADIQYSGHFDVMDFPAHSAHHKLNRCQMISVFEQVPSAIRIWHHSLVHSFGSAVLLKAGHGHAARDRHFYLVPALPNCPPIPSAPYQLRHNFSDASSWPAHEGGSSDSCPPTLRSIYPELLRRRANNTAPQSDLVTLKKFMVRTFDDNIIFSGPIQWCKWLGLDDNLSAKLLTTFPCLGKTQPQSPTSAAGTWGATTCGQEVLCNNCSRLCAILGRAWNVIEGTHILTATLRYNIDNMRLDPKHIQLYTAGSPCTRISKGIFCGNAASQLVGPHAHPSNAMWYWHQGLVQQAQRLYKQDGSINHFTQQFAHVCSNECPEAFTLQQARCLR